MAIQRSLRGASEEPQKNLRGCNGIVEEDEAEEVEEGA